MHTHSKLLLATTFVLASLVCPVHASKKTDFPKPKALVSTKLGFRYMWFIDKGISQMPGKLVDAWFAKSLAETILEQVKITGDLLIEKQQTALAHKLESFLTLARLPIAKSIVIALAEESLEPDYSKKNTSLLVKLFSSSESAESFFKKVITNEKSISKMCAEFIIFFNDLEFSLSAETQKYYLEAKEKKILESKEEN